MGTLLRLWMTRVSLLLRRDVKKDRTTQALLAWCMVLLRKISSRRPSLSPKLSNSGSQFCISGWMQRLPLKLFSGIEGNPTTRETFLSQNRPKSGCYFGQHNRQSIEHVVSAHETK